jgi:hypothetical protein
MAVTHYLYTKGILAAYNKEIDWASDNVSVALCSSSYTPNQDTHDYFNDVTNQLTTANGYTLEDGAGAGYSLTTLALSTTTNVLTKTADNPVWTSSGAGFTARILVVVDVTPGTSATDPLYSWSDFGQNETASGGGTFTYDWSGSGVVSTITATDATGYP